MVGRRKRCAGTEAVFCGGAHSRIHHLSARSCLPVRVSVCAPLAPVYRPIPSSSCPPSLSPAFSILAMAATPSFPPLSASLDRTGGERHCNERGKEKTADVPCAISLSVRFRHHHHRCLLLRLTRSRSPSLWLHPPSDSVGGGGAAFTQGRPPTNRCAHFHLFVEVGTSPCARARFSQRTHGSGLMTCHERDDEADDARRRGRKDKSERESHRQHAESTRVLFATTTAVDLRCSL